MQSAKVLCKQCGLCCIVKHTDGTWHSCKWLLIYAKGEGINEPSTRCAIYKWRLYSFVGNKKICLPRESSGYSYPNCPYNKLNEKPHPNYLKNSKNH